MRASIRNNAGFTLVELVMVIVILGVISVVVGRVLFEGYRTLITTENITEADWDGFFALERLTNDIHRLRSLADLTTIGAAQLTFTDVSGTAVQYQLSGGTIVRNTIPLIDGVQSFALSYLDKNGAQTASAQAVRYIQITLGLAQGNYATSFATMVAIRGAQ